MTDEIFENTTEDSATAEVHSRGYQNTWGEKLATFAIDAEQFNRGFSRTELGDGQLMSKAESSRLIAQHGLRQNAGEAANAVVSADLVWADVRVKEQRLVSKQLERGIQEAKNVLLGNELLFQVGKIPLHAEARTLQLTQLSNKVSGLRQSVKISTERLSIDNADGSIEIDFTEIKVE